MSPSSGSRSRRRRAWRRTPCRRSPAALLPELRGLAQDRRRVSPASVASARRSVVHRDELPPVVRLLVDRPQDLDDARLVLRRAGGAPRARSTASRARRPRRRRSEIDHRLVLVDGRPWLAQLCSRSRRAPGGTSPRPPGSALCSARRRSQVGEVAPALPTRVQAREGLEGVRVRLVDVERRAVRLDRRVVVAELRLFEERDRVERRRGAPSGSLRSRAPPGRASTRSPAGSTPGAGGRWPRTTRRSPPGRTRGPGGRTASARSTSFCASKSSPVRFASRAVAGSSDVIFSSSAAKISARRASAFATRASRSSSAQVASSVDVLGEELRRRLERGAVVLLLLLVQLRQAPQELPPLVGVLARREARLERRHHAPPVEARQVHRLEHLRGARRVLALAHERLERGDRLAGASRRWRAPPRTRRRRGRPPARRFSRTSPSAWCSARLARSLDVARRRDLPLVERDEVVPALGAARRGARATRSPRGVEAELEDLLVDGDGRARVAQRLVGEARLLEEERLPLASRPSATSARRLTMSSSAARPPVSS